MVFSLPTPTLTFVIVFLVFSLLFLSNSFKLWFKTDQYYAEMLESLNRAPSLLQGLFRSNMEDRPRWIFRQKVFSLLGVAAVLFADVMVVTAWLAK